MSGGSGNGTSTQIQDVPEWARGYAKTALGQASELTDISKNPYQSYGGERQAQFTPLQQQSYQGAAGMQAGPGAFQSQVGQYMSPYMQNVVNAQQQDATRQAGIAGQAQQAQAARMGAFGGSGDYLMRGQAAGNLARQKGDIQARGLQAAYDNATNQYNTGQGQGMAINQLQNQYGNQQQQQVQGILNQQYQDFQGQKKYPYQQLEFMSGLMRGTPMGTVSSMYEAPGSVMGQLGGLGMGAYGLSQMGMKFAGGGSITNPSEEKLEDMIDGLTDLQLQQIIQNPTSQKVLDVAQAEMAMRASLKNGIAGGLSNQAIERMMPTEEGMARGGVVAFANGGAEFGIEDPAAMALDELRVAEKQRVKDIEKAKIQANFLREAGAPQAAAAEARLTSLEGFSGGRGKTPASAYDVKAAAEHYGKTTRGKTQKDDKPAAATSQKIVQGATRIAEQQGVPKEDFESIMDRMMTKFKGANDKDLEGIKNYIAKSGKDAEGIKSEMLNKAITAFGFNMAAQASKPGQGKGLRGLMSSAAAAAPTISASVAESQKLIRAAEDNARKMEIEFAKYKVALNKGDQQMAMSMATNIRQLQQADRQYQVELAKLEEQKRYHNMVGEKYKASGEASILKRAQLGLQARRQGETRAMNEFKDALVANEYKKKGITPDMLAKKYAKEAQGDLLSSMITGLTPEED